MSGKQKTAALGSSSDSDSDFSDSEFQILAKKRKKGVLQDNSSPGDESARSDKKQKMNTTSGRGSDMEDGEVSGSDSEIGEFDDGLDDELMGDAADRACLQRMSEKEREEEIFKRAEKREMLKKRYEIEMKLKLQKKNNRDSDRDLSKGLDTKERSRARQDAIESKKDKKTLAMDVLKAKRKEKKEQQEKIEEKKKKEEEKDPKKWKANEIYSSDSSDEDISRPRSRSPEGRRQRSSSSSSSSSSIFNRSRSPSPVKRSSVSTKYDLEKMKVNRAELEKWCHLPMFVDLVIGCFVKVSIGEDKRGIPAYRVGEIIGVEEGKVYDLGSTRTNKTLKLRHANNERFFRIEYTSNRPFEELEFDKWREDTMLSGMYLPTLTEMEEKEKHIKRARSRVLNEKDIGHMIKEKAKFNDNPRNYAMYKSRLTKERDVAAAEGKHEEADRINSRLLEIEERAENLDKMRSEKISSIALINNRNRKNNIRKAEVNIKQEMEKKKLEGETQDPFTRRKTKPMLATSAIKKAPLPPHQADKLKGTDVRPAVGAEKPSLERRPPAAEKNVKAPGDLFSAHDFDIDINLDTFTPSSAIKMNLTPVANTKKELGPKKSLNLSDYKKKRGLI